MTRKFYQIGLVIAVAAAFIATPSFAGSKERDFFKMLLFPPIPVPVPGRSKPVDLNKAFREGKIPTPPTPKIVLPKPPKVVIPPAPRVSVSVSRHDHHSTHRSRHHHDHHVEEPRVHSCHVTTFSRVAPPAYHQVSCSTLRPSRHHVWIEGHWQRSCCGWKWVNGRWDLPPTRTAVWVPGTWVRTARGYHWISGGWSTATCY